MDHSKKIGVRISLRGVPDVFYVVDKDYNITFGYAVNVNFKGIGKFHSRGGYDSPAKAYRAGKAAIENARQRIKASQVENILNAQDC